MTDNVGLWLRWSAVILPTALAVAGVWVAVEVPKVEKTSTKWVLRIGFVLVGIIASVVVFLQQDYDRRQSDKEKNDTIGKIQQSIASDFSQLQEKRPAAPPSKPPITLATEKASVSAALIGGGYPVLVLDNKSNITASQIKYTIALWVVDDPRQFFPNPWATEPIHDALPIPVQAFDFISAHSKGGPEGFLSSVQQYLKKGQRIFGSIGVICANCARGRTYIVDFKLGSGGWYYEVPSMTNGGVLTPKHLTVTGVASYVDALAKLVPASGRKPIAG